MPSALLPYCSYQSKPLGKMIPGYDSLACDIFEPTLFNGRMCYSLKNEMTRKTKQGKANSLMLMIDPGQIEEENPNEESFSFELYIHTLSGFSGFRAGSYAMGSLKQMTGTSGFLNLPDDQKRCQVEVSEGCQPFHFLEEVQKQCGCIPWALIGKHMGKVKFRTKIRFYIYTQTNCFLRSNPVIRWTSHVLKEFLRRKVKLCVKPPVWDFMQM